MYLPFLLIFYCHCHSWPCVLLIYIFLYLSIIITKQHGLYLLWRGDITPSSNHKTRIEYMKRKKLDTQSSKKEPSVSSMTSGQYHFILIHVLNCRLTCNKTCTNVHVNMPFLIWFFFFIFSIKLNKRLVRPLIYMSTT